jgi:Amidohydrolase family
MKKAIVHLFVFDTMSDWEYGHLAAGINNPQFQKLPGKFKLKTVSLSDKPVVSMGGLRVTPNMTLDKRLTPLQALQAATLNPARVLEMTDSLGTIEPGKLADLVLLDANPLEDIHNTQKIRAVAADGRLSRRADLDQLLATAEKLDQLINPGHARHLPGGDVEPVPDVDPGDGEAAT